jgi:hypothetical protein
MATHTLTDKMALMERAVAIDQYHDALSDLRNAEAAAALWRDIVKALGLTHLVKEAAK